MPTNQAGTHLPCLELAAALTHLLGGLERLDVRLLAGLRGIDPDAGAEQGVGIRDLHKAGPFQYNQRSRASKLSSAWVDTS